MLVAVRISMDLAELGITLAVASIAGFTIGAFLARWTRRG